MIAIIGRRFDNRPVLAVCRLCNRRRAVCIAVDPNKKKGPDMNDQMRNSFTSVAPPIVASPAKRIQALTGDPDFMTSLARGLAVVQAFQERKRH